MSDWLIGTRDWSVSCDIALDIDHAPVAGDARMQSMVHAEGLITVGGGSGYATWVYDGLVTINAAGVITSFIGSIDLTVSLWGTIGSGSWAISTNGGSTGTFDVDIPGLHVARETSALVAGDVFDAPNPTDLETLIVRDTTRTGSASLTLFGHTVTTGAVTPPSGDQDVTVSGDGQVWASRLYIAFVDPGPGTTIVDQAITMHSDIGGSSVTGCSANYSTSSIEAAANSTPALSPVDPVIDQRVEAVIPASGISEVGEASSSIVFKADRPVVLDIKVMALKLAYPDALSATVTGMDASGSETLSLAAGAASDSFTQQSASGTARASIGTVAGAVYTPALWDDCSYTTQTYNPVSVKQTTASLSAAGDDIRLTRCRMRCWRYSPLSLAHADSVTVDAGTSLAPTGDWEGSWAGTGGASVSIVSGAVQVTGGTGVTRSFTDPVSLSGYPTLRIRAKSSAASEVLTVTIGSKRWEITTSATPGTYTDMDIDLSAELNGPLVSAADAHWPIEATDHLALTEKDYFGVWRASSIAITGMDSGETYDIDAISIRRDHTTYLDFLPVFYRGVASGSPISGIDEDWPVKQREDYTVSESGTFTETWARRFLLARTRGQQTLEKADALLQRTTGGGTGTVTLTHMIQSIDDLADSVNEVNADGTILNPGWTATKLIVPVAACATDPIPSLSLCRLSVDAPATELCGGGAIWDGSAWLWFDNYTIAAGAGATTILAALLADRITSWIPDGDLFDNHAGVDVAHTLYLKAGAMLRAAGHGEVLASDHERYDGPAAAAPLQNVNLSVGGSSRGNGIISSDGIWRIEDTGPYAKTQMTNRLAWSSWSSDATGYARHYRRVVFWDGTDEVTREVSFYRDHTDQMFFYTVRDSDLYLVCYRYHGRTDDPTTAPDVFVVDSSGTASLPSAARLSEDVHLCAYLVTGGIMKLGESRDAARTWTMITVPGTACDAFRMTAHRDRILIAKYITDEWFIMVATFDPSTGAFSFSSEVSIVAAGVADGVGDIRVHDDNVIEFAYLDVSGAPKIIRCHTLSAAAAGTWY